MFSGYSKHQRTLFPALQTSTPYGSVSWAQRAEQSPPQPWQGINASAFHVAAELRLSSAQRAAPARLAAREQCAPAAVKAPLPRRDGGRGQRMFTAQVTLRGGKQ